MYKVIIVDDEPIIVEGLKLGIEWANWNCEIAGTASNGLAGLELMRKIKPDILISDISMNNMDGLAMVAAIKSEYPDIEVCLLTGFRNFEYAQQAIKLGVTRFLLKPSKIDELEEAISAMTNNLKQKGNDSSNAEIDSIKDSLKHELNEQHSEELIAGTHIIRYTTVISNRFNSTEFKKVMPEVYKAYLKPVTSKRFTVA